MSANRVSDYLITLLLLGMTAQTAHADIFRCPSADAVSYFAYLESPSREEALKTARADWSFQFLDRPELCLTDAEFKVAYAAAFDNSPMFRAMREPIRQVDTPKPNRCGNLATDGEPWALVVARLMEAPAGCDRVLTVEQQLFVGGASGQLMQQCNLSVSDVGWRISRFMALTEVAALGGVREVPLGRGVEAVVTETAKVIAQARTPQLAGTVYAKNLGAAACKGDLTKRWFGGLEHYLDDTSRSTNAPFVASCVGYYRNTKTAGNCECVGDVLRMANPWIFTRQYEGDFLREGTKTIGLGMSLLACGIYRFDRPPSPRSIAPNPNVSKRRACDRFGEQGMGTKVPEEREALIERCMNADGESVLAADRTKRQAEMKNGTDYAAMRERRMELCRQLAGNIRRTEAGPQGAYAFGQRQLAFVSACGFNEANTGDTVTAEPAEWCRQFDGNISNLRAMLRGSPVLDARLLDTVESFRQNCDQGGDIVTGKANPRAR